MSTSVIIDDTSSDIFYTGNWGTGGAPAELDDTTHGTSAEGAQAIYHFYGMWFLLSSRTIKLISMTGSHIEVFGTIGRENNGSSFAATSSYTIDNNYNETVEFLGTIGPVVLYRQLFFSSQELEEGQHILNVTYKTPDKNPLWLDYFRVTRTLSPSTPLTTPSSSGLSTGAIVGIAVGGCAALTLLVTIIFLLRRRLRGQQSNIEAPPAYTTQEDLSWLRE